MDGSLRSGVKSSPVSLIGADMHKKLSDPIRYDKKTVTFNVVRMYDVPNAISLLGETFVGPLLDSMAPYSGAGVTEFLTLQAILLPDWDGKLEDVLIELKNRPYWQCGIGKHAIEARKIIGSVHLNIKSDNGNSVIIRHFIIKGSSQWVIEMNFMSQCKIEHIGHKKVILPRKVDSITIIDEDLYSYVPYVNLCRNISSSAITRIKSLNLQRHSYLMKEWNDLGPRSKRLWTNSINTYVDIIIIQRFKRCWKATCFGIRVCKSTLAADWMSSRVFLQLLCQRRPGKFP